MKKLVAMVCCGMMLAGIASSSVLADEGSSERSGQSSGIVSSDTISSASVSNAFVDKALTGDALMDAINNKGGVTVISTVSEEGEVNSAVLEWFMAKKDDEFYIAVNMMDNQTSANIDAGSDVFFLYANMDDPYEGETRVLPQPAQRWKQSL